MGTITHPSLPFGKSCGAPVPESIVRLLYIRLCVGVEHPDTRGPSSFPSLLGLAALLFQSSRVRTPSTSLPSRGCVELVRLLEPPESTLVEGLSIYLQRASPVSVLRLTISSLSFRYSSQYGYWSFTLYGLCARFGRLLPLLYRANINTHSPQAIVT